MSKLWKDFKRIIKSHYKINVRSFNDTYYGDDRYIRTKYNFTIDEVPNWLFGLWFTNNINHKQNPFLTQKNINFI